MKREFPKGMLKDWGLPYGFDAVEVEAEILAKKETDTSRWHQHHHLVFVAPDDGKVWRVGYSSALTEIQDMQPWDSEDVHVNMGDTVTGVEVEPATVVVTIYQPVED